MKKTLLLALLFSLLLSTISYAQFTISDKSLAEPIIYKEKLVYPLESHFISKTPAWFKEQKRLKRLEQNFFETKTNLTFNQFSYMNWAAGGESSYNGKLTTLNTHSFRKRDFTIDSYLNAAIGLGKRNGELWKTEDNLEINSVMNYRIWGKWTYSLGVNFSTQFANGYGSSDTPYTSSFFAPATIKPFTGVSFRYSDTQIITLAPISGNLLFVGDERLSNEGAFGIDKGKRFKPTLGSYINVQWTQKIDKNGILTYKTNGQIFCDYKSAPVLGWENWIDITVFKYLKVGLYLNIIYNNQIARQEGNTSFWQLNQNLGVGVSYNFKNKESNTNKGRQTKFYR